MSPRKQSPWLSGRSAFGNPKARASERTCVDPGLHPGLDARLLLRRVTAASLHAHVRGTFDSAQAELDKLAQLPNITEPQKKALDEVVEQIKTAIKAGAAAPTQ